MTYKVEDNDDLEVTGRILDVLNAARDIYRDGNRSEGWWDGAIDYILDGSHVPNTDGSNPWLIRANSR